MTRAELIDAGHAKLMLAIPAEYGANHVWHLAAQVACCSTAFTRFLGGEELNVSAALAEAGIEI